MLSLRLASALVLAPLALAAAWLGPPYVTLMALIAAIGMGWEWQRLAAPDQRSLSVLILATILLPVCLMIAGAGRAAPAVALVGAGAVWIAAGRAGALWAALGTLWIALACLAFLAIALSSTGSTAILWLFAIVWSTDCGAYVAGRGLGGPLLAPWISPKKTWAGLAGGLTAAVAVALVATWLKPGNAAWLIGVALVLSIATHLGDLVESLAKRHFGVKDSGTIIPGHGGLLDRLDGLLAASLLQFLIAFASGESALPWRF